MNIYGYTVSKNYWGRGICEQKYCGHYATFYLKRKLRRKFPNLPIWVCPKHARENDLKTLNDYVVIRDIGFVK